MTESPTARYDFLRRWTPPATWTRCQLGTVSAVVGGGTPSRDVARYWDGGQVPKATPTDLTANTAKYLTATAETITCAGLQDSAANLLPVDAVLYTSRATIGAKALAAMPTATNQGFASFIPSGIEPDYLYYLLDLLKPAITRLAAGTTFLEVSKRDIRRAWCAFPSDRVDRDRIAVTLSSLDDVIEQARTVLVNAQAVKRALMQSLLPPWIGFRRIAVGNDHGVEEILPAQQVADVRNGSTPSREERRYWREGTIPWLATGKVHERVIWSADEHVTEAALRECSIELLPAGTVLVAMIGQGRTRGMAALLASEACINQNFGALTPRRSPVPRVIGKWLFYYLDYHYSKVRQLAAGTNQGALSCYLLRRIRLPLPGVVDQEDVATTLDAAEAVELEARAFVTRLTNLKTTLIRDLMTGRANVSAGLSGSGEA